MSDIAKVKDIDVRTKKGLYDLETKAFYYGHYAEQLKVLELIAEIERLKEEIVNLRIELSMEWGE